MISAVLDANIIASGILGFHNPDSIPGTTSRPEDDLVLATAVSAKANYLVTGDEPLLKKVGSSYQGVKLVTPKEFVQILQKQRGNT